MRLSFIRLHFDEFFISADFILALLVVIFVLVLYVKSPVIERDIEKVSIFYNWVDLLILIFTPLLLYLLLISLNIRHSRDWLLVTGPVLGFILSLLYILYVELTRRLKKVRLFYFFIIACVCTILISFSFLLNRY
ncbi:hypothetical protein [Leptospira alstonii]|uniref:hypothetical protein n=1 Tax=Leptospira alstonii TaxID=28452 RepID=UPI0007733F9B